MTTEEQIAAIAKGESVTTTTGKAIVDNAKSIAEKVEENKIEVPAEEPVKDSEVSETQDVVAIGETADKEPEIAVPDLGEPQINFEPDVKLNDVVPIPLDGIDIGLGSAGTMDNTIVSEFNGPDETNEADIYNITSPSNTTWDTPEENAVQESQSFMNNEQSFDSNDQFVKSFEPSVFESYNESGKESDKILKYIESTRVNKQTEIVRQNTITTNPEVAVDVIKGIFENQPFKKAIESIGDYVFNQVQALKITNDQLTEVHNNEPLHKITMDKNDVVFKLNRGEISTDEFPGFINKVSESDSEVNFSDQQSKIVSFPGNYEMQQVDSYGNLINMSNSFGDSDQNLNSDFNNSKPFAA